MLTLQTKSDKIIKKKYGNEKNISFANVYILNN